MALYAGLSPTDALNKWYAIRQKPQGSLTPEEREDVSGNMIGLAKENPGAWAVVKNGIEDPKSSDYFYAFNPNNGQFERREHKGFWSHPESWLQVGFGAGLGGVAAAGALGGAAAPAASTSSGAAPIAGTGGGALVGGIPTTAGLPGGIGVGATAIPAAAPVVAKAGMSLWDKLAYATPLIGMGANLVGAKIATDASSDAARIQAESFDKALEEQRRQYDLQRSDLAPYRALGAGATGRLGDLWGFDPPQTETNPIKGSGPQTSVLASAIGPAGVTVPGLGTASPHAPQAAPQPAGATMPQVGETRMINGQQGRWDGQGWEAV